MDSEYKAVKFVDNGFELEVRTDIEHETVWLTKSQMADLFERDRSVISKHIKNVFDEKELVKKSNVQKMHVPNSDKPVEFYSLDTIISIGYRVKSTRGTQFRIWANKILKGYLLQGYAVNKRRIEVLNKTIDIQNRMLSSALSIDQESLINAVDEYTNALDLLDDYDHQCVIKPTGNKAKYIIDYSDCRKIIDSMKFSDVSNVFGVEKEEGKLNGILCAINQTAFGEEIYPTIEEKAAHLLYFLVKDHPFVDGCKRIAATLFLEYLNRNNILVRNNRLIIANDTLVAITVLTAESKPEEMEVIIKLIMRFLVSDNLRS